MPTKSSCGIFLRLYAMLLRPDLILSHLLFSALVATQCKVSMSRAWFVLATALRSGPVRHFCAAHPPSCTTPALLLLSGLTYTWRTLRALTQRQLVRRAWCRPLRVITSSSIAPEVLQPTGKGMLCLVIMLMLLGFCTAALLSLLLGALILRDTRRGEEKNH